ncbi:MAG: hypothetical protein WBA96_13345, partial [Chitinophagaceae bacterium]
QAGSGWGVYGTTPGGIGVNGATTSGIGVNGSSSSGTGVNGSSTSGVGVFGTSSTSNAGSFTNTNAANAAATLNVNSNGTGWAGDFTSTNATTRALRTAGGVRLTGINEAANRILATIPGNGDATWQSPAAVGIVTGSGTLNFVPKWTPNGTNLGNSQIFDNGTSVGISTTTLAPDFRLSVNNSAAGSFAATKYTNTATGEGFLDGFFVGQNGQTTDAGALMWNMENSYLSLGTNFTDRLFISPAGDVGIGTNLVNPTARLQLVSAGTNPGMIINHSNAANIQRGLTVLSANITATAFGNGAIYGQRGTNGATNFLFTGGGAPTATTGIAGGAAGIGVQGSGNTFGTVGVTNTGIGVLAYAVDPTGYGLVTNGRVQIAGQNAGLNRVLTSDALGNATWQTLGAGVGVGGSGTLNYVSKWTPDGTNLGNSQITDNGNTVSVGFPFFANNSITVQQTPAAPVNPSIAMISASRAAGSYLENSTGNVYFTAGANTVASGSKIMTLGLSGLNVGINTVAPGANTKLHVTGYGSGADQTSIYANGEAGASDGHGVIGDGEWRGLWGRNAGVGGRVEASGVRGDVTGSNYDIGVGVWGTSTGTGFDNYGVIGQADNSAANNIGVYGEAPAGANNWAGTFWGRVFIQDGTQGAGKIFTSDAVGNGSWQTAAAAGVVSGSGTTNFVPKWTPNGVTIGNSRLFDDGSFTGLGTTTNYDGQDIFNIEGNFTRSGITMRNNFGGNDVRGFINARDGGFVGLQLGTVSNHGISIWTNNNLRAVMDASGNLGLGNPAPTAKLDVAGTFKLVDGTQAAGYVLTSDAAGNASWQTVNVGIGLQTLAANVVIAPASFVSITSWNTITHETGGANYNAGTGEYTITVAGVYQINASLAFSPGGPDAIDIILDNNGSPINEITQYIEPTGFTYGMNLNCLRHLNVGDKLSIRAGHNGAAAVTLVAGFTSNNFSVQMVTRD